MKWDQIESKWALMTRRIRCDFGEDRPDATEAPVRLIKRRDVVSPSIADSLTSAVKESEIKISAK